MSGKNYNIEDVFRDAFREHLETPSPGVLKSIRWKLWKRDFLSLDMSRFNVVYTSLIVVVGLAGGYSLLNTSVPVVEKISTEFSEPIIAEETPALPEAETAAPKAEAEMHRAENSPTLATPKTDIEEKSRLKAFYSASAFKGCAPLTVKFQNKSMDASKFNWDFGNGQSSKDENPSYTFNEPGEYKVVLTSTDKKKNTETFEKTISVYPVPKAGLEIDIDKSDIGTRQLQFKNTSEAGQSYLWSFGDSGTSEDQNPVHTYADYGSYHVKLIAVNEYGCADSTLFVNAFIDKNYQLAFPFNFRPSVYDQANNGYYEGGSRGSIFYPKNFGAKAYELSVYAPNGMKVFNTTDIKQGWNGFIGGRVAPGGYYTYVAKGIYPNSKPFEIEGRVKVMVDQLMENY